MNGSGTGDLLDAVADKLIDKSSAEEESELPKFAIVGRPNVGKSSLTNALVGEDRNIVTDVAGTTRDSINIRFNKFGHDFLLIDTAGLRKKTKVHEDLEFYSVMRAIRAIEHSDVCFIMIDAQTDMESQDVNILMLAKKNKKGVVILVNKWDLIENKESNTVKKFNEQIKQDIRDKLPLENIKITSLIEQFIWESLKNSYDACLDKFLKLGGNNYHANVSWEYKNGHFRVLITDNGFGAKSSDSITKRTRGQQFYLGGAGKGVYLIRFKMEDLKEEVGFDYDIELITRDDEGNPEKAFLVAQEIVEQVFQLRISQSMNMEHEFPS